MGRGGVGPGAGQDCAYSSFCLSNLPVTLPGLSSPGKGAENGVCVYVCMNTHTCVHTDTQNTSLQNTLREK